MASLQQKGNGWYCRFVHRGKRHTFAVGQVTRAEAAQVDYLMMRLKQGLIALPPGADVVALVRHDGTIPAEPEAARLAVSRLCPTCATATLGRTRRRSNTTRCAAYGSISAT
jgi:hypothetical protein